MRENQGRGVGERRKKRAQTDRKGEQSEEREIGEEKENESGKRQSRGLRNEATDRQRGTMSSAVVPAGVRQVHLMTHLSV